MNLKLNVIRFNNEDVIATSSCADAKGVAFYEEGHWFYALNGKLMTNLTGVQGSTEGLDPSNCYHVDAEGNIYQATSVPIKTHAMRLKITVLKLRCNTLKI